MPRIRVPHPFRLNENGEMRHFVAGEHDVDQAIAAHWWVKAHSEPVEIVQAPEDVIVEEVSTDPTPAGTGRGKRGRREVP